MRRALTKLLPEDRQSFAKRSCKSSNNNERPKYQNLRVLLSSAAFFLIRFSDLAAKQIAAPAGGCFHLSPRSTEMAERSSRRKSRLKDVAVTFECEVHCEASPRLERREGK
jgi:hypothetical protein